MKREVPFHLERIAEDSAALVDAARKVDLGAPVPSCPGWNVGDLVWHIGWVHRQKTWIVKELRSDTSGWVEEPAPTDDELLEWFEAGVDEMLSVFGAADPAAPAFNWSEGPDVVEFWPRRMAHETSVHRWDAQAATGAPEPIHSTLATDGVDEFLTVFAPASEGAPAEPHGSIHLHRTDGEGEWFVRMDADGVSVTNEHAKGDVAVRGPSSDLVLMLWGRVPRARLETFGEPAVLDNLLGWVDTT